MNRSDLFYYFIKALTYPLSFIPYRGIHFLGKIVGTFGYFLVKDYRKRTLSNLSLAFDLKITNKKELISIAKKSFHNLAINILEYPRLARENDFSKVITCLNPEKALEIHKSGKGIIFFCGHQANWEILFLDGNLRMKGIAIGKPIKNKKLYEWIVSIREKTGGRIIEPKKAMKEGLRSLKKGEFIGIVGDQGMPGSNYSFPFFGRKAWNSTAPALLSYKTKSPIIVATIVRNKGKYLITYSDPIFPNTEAELDKEVKNLMDKSLKILEGSIKEIPDQWLWQHNRWKQHSPHQIKKEFRHDSICIILPEERSKLEYIFKSLPTLKEIYSNDFISVYLPSCYEKEFDLIQVDEVKRYESTHDLFVKDYRFKLIFNFSGNKKIKNHYKRLSAFEVVTIEDLLKIAKKMSPERKFEELSDIFISSLCRPDSIITQKRS